MPLISVTNVSKAKARNRLAKLSEHCIEQISSRTNGLDPVDSREVFAGDPTLTNVPRNSGLWAADLVSQISGNPVWKTGWVQGAGGVPITRRHLLQCAHWGVDSTNLYVRFIKPDSSAYFETQIIKQIPAGAASYYSHDLRTYDFEVWLLADELPVWVNIFSIIELSAGTLSMFPQSNTASFNAPVLPMVAISQGKTNAEPGNVQKLYVNNAYYYSEYDPSLPPNTIYGKRHPHPDLHEFFYDVYIGDSGTPAFLLINDVLYLAAIVTSSGFGLTPLWTQAAVAAVNQMILDVDALAGISTGLTPNVVQEPTF